MSHYFDIPIHSFYTVSCPDHTHVTFYTHIIPHRFHTTYHAHYVDITLYRIYMQIYLICIISLSSHNYTLFLSQDILPPLFFFGGGGCSGLSEKDKEKHVLKNTIFLWQFISLRKRIILFFKYLFFLLGTVQGSLKKRKQTLWVPISLTCGL